MSALAEGVKEAGALCAALAGVGAFVWQAYRYVDRALVGRIVEMQRSLAPNGGSSIGDLPERFTQMCEAVDAIGARLARVEESQEILRHAVNRPRR